jgi:hypothetical protein
MTGGWPYIGAQWFWSVDSIPTRTLFHEFWLCRLYQARQLVILEVLLSFVRHVAKLGRYLLIGYNDKI